MNCVVEIIAVHYVSFVLEQGVLMDTLIEIEVNLEGVAGCGY